VELYYFLLPTKRNGGPTAGDPGLKKTLVGHRLSSTKSFVFFGQPIKANTGTVASFELNPTLFLAHSFTRTVMRFTHTLLRMRKLAFLYALNRESLDEYWIKFI
jgi:hypothetical protein